MRWGQIPFLPPPLLGLSRPLFLLLYPKPKKPSEPVLPQFKTISASGLGKQISEGPSITDALTLHPEISSDQNEKPQTRPSPTLASCWLTLGGEI